LAGNNETRILDILQHIQSAVGEIKVELIDVKYRVSTLESRLVNLERNLVEYRAATIGQPFSMDRLEERIERIEQRLD